MLTRLSPAIAWWMVSVFLMGAQFMFSALNGGIPMPPETHGEVVYEAPAELWAGLYMLFSALVLAGLWCRLSWLVCLGAFIGLMTNVVFAVAAHEAEFGYLLEKGASRDAFQYAGLLLAGWFSPLRRNHK